MTPVTVRPMTAGDADPVLAIYQAGLDSGNASFEHTAPTWEAFDTAKLPDHRLVASTEAARIWTIQSGIFPENAASLVLHRAAGFRTVGVRERVGRHAGRGNRWRDVVFIERRSSAIT